MGQHQPKTKEQILQRMVNRTVARSNLNDLNDGSSVKQVLAAAAREDDDCHFQMINLTALFDLDTCIGEDLDERAKEMNPALISRNAAQKATGEVVFSRTGTTGNVTIAIGTMIQVPAVGAQPPIVFVTIEEGTISDGNQDSNDVSVAALLAGASGNIDSGTLTAFQTKPSGVDSVTNAAAFTNGMDIETDDSFRRRLKAMVKGLARCHVDGLESAVMDVYDSTTGKRVVFSHVYEDPINRGEVILYIDDGAGTAGDDTTLETDKTVIASATGGETVFFLPDYPIKTELSFVLKRNGGVLEEDDDYTLNPASGQINLLPASFPDGLLATDSITYSGTHFGGLIKECQKVIDGDATDRGTYPGYRAAGVLVRVLSPGIEYQTIQANITVLQDYNQVDVAAVVSTALSGYINSLGISEDVILNELRERAMAVPGMYDVEFELPTENKVILDNQIARILDSQITIV